MFFVTFQLVFQLVKCYLERKKSVLGQDEDTMFELLTNYEICEDTGPPNSRLSVNENDLRGIKMTPPPYLQRFGAVRSIIDAENLVNVHFRKVVEFGCADLKMAQILKYVNNLEELIFVDKDRQILDQCNGRIQPTEDDNFYYRKNPLSVKVYEGCCTRYDKVMENADAVICIELIQTLSPEELDRMTKNIFENIQPEMVIFTTPNKDFNPLLDLTSNLKRHRTHKFEWTRNQLINWGKNVARTYPNYLPFFYGCGAANRSHMQKLGPITLVCAFRRLHKVYREVERTESNYKLVAQAQYLYLTDVQLLEQAIWRIRQVKTHNWNQWEFSECNENEIPISEVFAELYYRTGYGRFLEVIRKDGWIFDERRNVIIYCPHFDISRARFGRNEE